jgi:hypothetical protein
LVRYPREIRARQGDPFAVLDRIGEVFKDVPPEEIEREVARLTQEDGEEQRARRRSPPRRTR